MRARLIIVAYLRRKSGDKLCDINGILKEGRRFRKGNLYENKLFLDGIKSIKGETCLGAIFENDGKCQTLIFG